MISLSFPWALLMLPLPLFVWLLVPPYRDRMPSLRVPFFNQIVEATGSEARSGSFIRSRTVLQNVSAFVIWCLLVLSASQPEMVGEPVEIEKSARDLVIAIDISGSMDAVDFASPDGQHKQRLAGVQEVVEQFVSRREGDRIALIVFGSKAYVQAPLTSDLATVSQLLKQTEVGIAGPHTALGDAIGLAIRTFEASEIDQRLLILLSDGTDTGSRMSPINAAQIAGSRGIEIDTIAVGDPSATDENKVDIDTLKAIAAQTSGNFFFAADEAGLHQVYQRIDELSPRAVKKLSFRPRQSLSHLPLGAATGLGLAMLAWLSFGLQERKKRT